MGISHGRCGKRGKEPGVKDAPDLILAAKIRPEHPVGPAFREDLVKKHVSLDADIGTHGNQPFSVVSQARDMKVAEETAFMRPDGIRRAFGASLISALEKTISCDTKPPSCATSPPSGDGRSKDRLSKDNTSLSQCGGCHSGGGGA